MLLNWKFLCFLIYQKQYFLLDQDSFRGYNYHIQYPVQHPVQYPVQPASYQIQDSCQTVWYYIGHPYYCWFQSVPPPPPTPLPPLPTPKPTYYPSVTSTVKPTGNQICIPYFFMFELAKNRFSLWNTGLKTEFLKSVMKF